VDASAFDSRLINVEIEVRRDIFGVKLMTAALRLGGVLEVRIAAVRWSFFLVDNKRRLCSIYVLTEEEQPMARESTQHKLDRVRAPRVQITYDVEVGGAIEIKDLPFVLGVLGDFSGQPEQSLAAMKDRKFVEINPDNFDKVLKGMAPHLSYSVKNTLSAEPDAGQVKVDLKFESMDDFSPENVAKQVRPLKELLDLRGKLSDLRGSLQGNDKLDDVLMEVLSSTEKRNKLKIEMAKTSEETNQ
jgi:type VI secretion system protein ImpB